MRIGKRNAPMVFGGLRSTFAACRDRNRRHDYQRSAVCGVCVLSADGNEQSRIKSQHVRDKNLVERIELEVGNKSAWRRHQRYQSHSRLAFDKQRIEESSRDRKKNPKPKRTKETLLRTLELDQLISSQQYVATTAIPSALHLLPDTV